MSKEVLKSYIAISASYKMFIKYVLINFSNLLINFTKRGLLMEHFINILMYLAWKMSMRISQENCSFSIVL